MSKTKQKKKLSQIKRKQMIQEVFKKGKKQREIANKFDEKIAKKQGGSKREKFLQMKTKKKERNVSRDQVAELDKKFDSIRANRKPGQSIL